MRFREALESHMHNVGLGDLLEQRARNTRSAAEPRRAVVKRTRLGLCQLDQLLDRLGRRVGRHHQDERCGRNLAHPHEVLHGIERQVLVEMADDGVPVGREHQRVAVGSPLGHAGGASQSRAVLHDHVLIPALL